MIRLAVFFFIGIPIACLLVFFMDNITAYAGIAEIEYKFLCGLFVGAITLIASDLIHKKFGGRK